MMNYYSYFRDGGYMMSNWQAPWGPLFWFPGLVIGLLVWSLIWKGMALWKAAKKNDRNWFIALLLINTAGILDILYIYVFSKGTKKD